MINNKSDVVSMNDKRTFWKAKSCDKPTLEVGSDYLVIGRGGLAAKDEMGNTM